MSDEPVKPWAEAQVSPPEFEKFLQAQQVIRQGEEAKAVLARQIIGTRAIDLTDGRLYRFEFTTRQSEPDDDGKTHTLGWLEVYDEGEAPPPEEPEGDAQSGSAMPPPKVLPPVEDAPAEGTDVKA